MKNPAVAAYDPTGLRSTMTATHEQLEIAVLANAYPTHLPQPEWWEEYDEMSAERERKGLPEPVGRRSKLVHSDNYYKVRW